MNDKIEKVEVFCEQNATVGIDVPDLKLSRTWNGKGTMHRIDFGTLEEALYNPGVAYMFEHGILYIKDMDQKKRLGLEPEDATQPENIIVLTDAQRERYLTVVPLQEFKDLVKKLSKEQAEELANYAVKHEIMDANKAKTLKDKTGIDVLRAIIINQKSEEMDKNKEA